MVFYLFKSISHLAFISYLALISFTILTIIIFFYLYYYFSNNKNVKLASDNLYQSDK